MGFRVKGFRVLGVLGLGHNGFRVSGIKEVLHFGPRPASWAGTQDPLQKGFRVLGI